MSRESFPPLEEDGVLPAPSPPGSWSAAAEASARALLHSNGCMVVLSQPPGENGPQEASASGRARGLRLLGALGGAFLGLVLLTAASSKSLDPASFAAEIERHGLAQGWVSEVLAIAALGLEAGLGFALLLNLRHRVVLGVASGLVLFFLALTGRDWWLAHRGLLSQETACGCFGNLIERTPKEAFLQDLFLLLPAAALSWVGRPSRAQRGFFWRFVFSTVMAFVTMVFAWMAPALPLDDYATRLRPGVPLAALCVGKGQDRLCLGDLVPSLATGRHWVVLADAKNPGFPALSQEINGRIGQSAGDPVHVLAELTADEERRIFWTLAPLYELHAVPQVLLRSLYRSLPRSFLVEGGRVVKTSPGLDPDLGTPQLEVEGSGILEGGVK